MGSLLKMTWTKLSLTFILSLSFTNGKVVNFEDAGGLPDDFANEAAWNNGRLMNLTLASLMPGDTFLIPNKTFMMMGGIRVYDLQSVTFQIDGSIIFSNNMDEWPREASGDVLECIHFFNLDNV